MAPPVSRLGKPITDGASRYRRMSPLTIAAATMTKAATPNTVHEPNAPPTRPAIRTAPTKLAPFNFLFAPKQSPPSRSASSSRQARLHLRQRRILPKQPTNIGRQLGLE